MSPKSITTAGGWRCDPLVNANVTRHDACRQSRDCASSPATAEVRSLQFFFGPVRVPTDTRSSRGKRARPALTQPPSSPLPEPQGEGPQGHEGRVPRRHGRRSGAAGASPPRSCAREARETFGPTPSLIAPHQRLRVSSPRRRSSESFVKSFFFFFSRNTFARFVSRFVILRSPRRRHVAPVPGDGRARGQGGRRARPVLPPVQARAVGAVSRGGARPRRRGAAPGAGSAPRAHASPVRAMLAVARRPRAPPEPPRAPPGRARRAASGAPASTRRRPWTTSPPPRWA